MENIPETPLNFFGIAACPGKSGFEKIPKFT
jgi:hypothetical protein